MKDTFGYLGTEPMALREQLDQLSTALQEMAKAEGAEAIRRQATPRAASPTGRRDRRELADELAGKADAVNGRRGQGPRPGRRRHPRHSL